MGRGYRRRPGSRRAHRPPAVQRVPREQQRVQTLASTWVLQSVAGGDAGAADLRLRGPLRVHELHAEHGDDAAGRVLGEFRAVTRRLASERGVRVAKWLGDGCMVVAIDQEDMIAFALDLEREATAACDPLSLRIGVATGRALLFEGDDYIGSAVNLAARLCDAAGPGEVLVPAEQARPARGRHRHPPRRHRAPRLPAAGDRGQPGRHADGAGPQRHRRALDPLAVPRLTCTDGRSPGPGTAAALNAGATGYRFTVGHGETDSLEWTLESVHFPDPVTRWSAALYTTTQTAVIEQLMAELGILLDGIAFRELDGRIYTALVPFGGAARKPLPRWLLPIVSRTSPHVAAAARRGPRRRRERLVGRGRRGVARASRGRPARAGPGLPGR